MAQFDESQHNRDSRGQFASKGPADESGVELELGAGPQPAADPESDITGRWARHLRPSSPPDSITVVTCGPDELSTYVYHPDWEVRADAAANPHLTEHQATWLADPNRQPVGVRAAVALSGARGAAHRAAQDPSPTVRTLVADDFEITDEDRERLSADPAVGRIRELLHLG